MTFSSEVMRGACGASTAHLCARTTTFATIAGGADMVTSKAMPAKCSLLSNLPSLFSHVPSLRQRGDNFAQLVVHRARARS